MKTLLLTIILLLPLVCLAERIAVSFHSKQWRFETDDYRIENHLGMESLYLNKNRAFLSGASFRNGIIEYDVAFPEGRAFIGVMFRVADSLNYEEFYIRTHQSGNPDANQYTPVYHGLSAWQLYYGDGYGTPVQYRYRAWNHVRLVISGSVMEIYVNDMNKPLTVSPLKRHVISGDIGFGNFLSENHFANFSYEPWPDDRGSSPSTLKPPAIRKLEPGVVNEWQVSSPFAEAVLNTTTLSAQLLKDLSWTRSTIDEGVGSLNIASVVKWTKEKNTVLVKLTIAADLQQVKKFSFGFSDRCKVYLNGLLLFSGEDGFNSRDYRFLGTIGFYDTVYLPLKRGENELIIAVSENFGGWGIQGKIEDRRGIQLITR